MQQFLWNTIQNKLYTWYLDQEFQIILPNRIPAVAPVGIFSSILMSLATASSELDQTKT